jgi:predicted ribosomally synthesized peptide with nif11-like leader
MSESDFSEFTKLVQNDQKLLERLKAAENPEALVAIAAEVGFSFSLEDFTGNQLSTKDLSDEDLESVSGGFLPVAVGGGTILGREKSWWLCDVKALGVKGPGGIGGHIEFK